MSDIVNWMQQLPEPDGLDLTTRYVLFMAICKAMRARSEKIQPEHLFLGLMQRHDITIVRMCDSLELDLMAIYKHLQQLSKHPDVLKGPPFRFKQYLILKHRAFQEWLQSSHEEDRSELNQAVIEHQWRIAEEQYRIGELLMARIIDYDTNGWIVDMRGIRGIVPISEIISVMSEDGENQKIVTKLHAMKDMEIKLKIIDIDRSRNRLILSERQAVHEMRWTRREELLEELKPGETRRGVANNIANFGIFVDLGGIVGLVDVSELSWKPINHPSELFKVGQQVEVQVLRVDKENKKIALSVKRAQVDPWKEEPLKAAAPDAGEGKDGLSFSQEALECLNWAISFAKHVHSTVVYPDHLLLSVLLQKRIQSYLAALLPSSEVLLRYFIGRTVLDVKSKVSQSAVCPACKQSTLSGWKHCVYCGASLATVCPKCGAPYPEIEGARFCFECGEPLEE